MSTVRGLPELTRGQWGTLALLFGTYACFTLVRSAFSACMPAIKSDAALQMTAGRLANVQTAGTGAYLAGKFVGGLLTDRLGGRAALLVSLLVVTGCNFLVATSGSWGAVAAYIAVSQAFSASSWGACSIIIRAWLPPDAWASAFGVMAVSSRGGAMVAGLVLGGVQSAGYGWRTTYLVAVCIGFSAFLPSLFLLRPRPGAAWPLGGLFCRVGGWCGLCGGARRGSGGGAPYMSLTGVADDVDTALADGDGTPTESDPTPKDVDEEGLAPAKEGRDIDAETTPQALKRFAGSAQVWLAVVCNMSMTGMMEIQYFMPLLLTEAADMLKGTAATYASFFPAGILLAVLFGARAYDVLPPAKGSLLVAASMVGAGVFMLLLCGIAYGAVPASRALILLALVGFGVSIGTPYYCALSVFSLRFAGAGHVALLGNLNDAAAYTTALVVDYGAPRLSAAHGWGIVLLIEVGVAVAGVLAFAPFLKMEAKARSRQRTTVLDGRK